MSNQPKFLKVASAQYPIGQPKTLAEWEQKVAVWAKNGAATGASLLVFPEYAAIEQAACFGPDVYGDLKLTLAKVAELTAARVQFHADLAKKHKVHILAGSGPVLKSDGRYVNAAQLVTPDPMRGRVAAVSSVFIGASNELGEFESGVVGRFLGPVGAALFGGVGALIVTVLWAKLFPALRKADRLE